LQFLNQQGVSFVVVNFLVFPVRKRMRRGRHDRQSGLPCQAGNDAAQTRDVRARFLDVFANPGAHLDHRLNHLGLDLLAENHLPFFEKL
jgi:hypothetical protein